MKIVDIQPFETWYDGNKVLVTKLGMNIANDDMVQQVEFKYFLFNNDTTVFMNYIIMGGQDYINWNGSNEEATIWIASNLNLILV